MTEESDGVMDVSVRRDLSRRWASVWLARNLLGEIGRAGCKGTAGTKGCTTAGAIVGEGRGVGVAAGLLARP
ncbi:MAG TPA: hypothetical protein VM934_12690 [Pyrinomonadaceae bacterium]|nr:hypothetical protein [Pyrinomonadaceae bacterium]